MVFRRSSSGLSNLHLFTNTHAVVFVEGGRSLSVSEVRGGSFNESSIDVTYWQAIFNHHLPRRKFEFRAVGSKQTLMDIADDLARGQVKNVCVAMDRDFDHVKGGGKFSHPGIFCTYGYSWENDVWQPNVVESVVRKCTSLPSTASLAPKISCLYNEFYRSAASLVKLEVQEIASGRTFIPREGYGRLLQPDKVKLNRSSIANLLREARTNGYKISNQVVDVQKDCYGHLLGHFGREVADHIHYQYANSKTGLKKMIFDCLAINCLLDLLKLEVCQNLAKHFQIQFGRLPKQFFPRLKRT